MPTFRRIARASALLVVVVLAQAALAQTRSAGNDEVRDPEVQLPPPSVAGEPCLVTPAVAEDTRLNRDVLRVIQTNPYHARNSTPQAQRFVFAVASSTFTASIEEKYTPAGCGFFLYERLYTFNNTDGKYSQIQNGIALTGFGGELLFFEGKMNTREAYGRRVEKKGWHQVTSLEVSGDISPVAVGNRYTIRLKRNFSNGFNQFFSGAGYITSNRCEVTEQRAATDFNPRLNGNAFVTVCQNEKSKGSKRDVSTVKSVSFPEIDQRFSFDPEKCRLEWRSAADFNRSLHGDAFAMRCTGADLNQVFLPELGWWFPVDSIDGTFKSDPKARRLLSEVGQAR
jgi:hypothetical protein